MSQPPYPTPSTPFPTFLIDEVMPRLKDTEWRLLCVLVRQTLGWREMAHSTGTRRRKTADWLSHSQFKSRTGRASEAVSTSLDALVRQGLIEAWDEAGKCLLTAAERRRSTSRLFWRLGPQVRRRLQGGNGREIEAQEPKSERGSSESEIRKAKTTKETQTKYISPHGDSKPHEASALHRDKSPKGTKTTEPTPSQVKQLLHTYQEMFQQRAPRGEPPPILWGRDGKIVKDLLKLYGFERLVELLEQFFHSSDPWIKKCGYSLPIFRSSIGQLLMSEPQPRPTLPQVTVPQTPQDVSPLKLRTNHWTRAAELAQLRYCNQLEGTQREES